MLNLSPTKSYRIRVYILTRSPDDSFMYSSWRSTYLEPLLSALFQAPKLTKLTSHRTVPSLLYFPACHLFPDSHDMAELPKVTLHFDSFQEFSPKITGLEDGIPSLLFRRAALTELLTET